jgi:N-acetylmuramoyl-L-alanine amidase
MTPIIIFIDIGHGDKGAGEPHDPGATFDGRVERTQAEDYARRLGEMLAAEPGVRVVTLGTGSYDSRHRAVIAQAGAARGIYLQCHLNAGRGTYALIRPDARSQQGARAAALVAAALDAALPEVTSHRSDPLYPSNAAAQAAGRKTDGVGSWWTRGFNCIDGVWSAPRVCGLVVEPGFIDAPGHVSLWTPEGRQRVAEAIAAGLLQWRATL